MELEILKVCIDGVDLSGKTTLWNRLHKESGFRWKLEDRSFVTMAVYAIHHNRPKAADYYRQLIEDLSNLNIRYVLFNPSYSLIEERYKKRGDDLYSLSSLSTIREIYSVIIKTVAGFPNVLVLDGTESEEENTKIVKDWLTKAESVTLDDVTKLVLQRTMASSSGEVSPLRIQFIDTFELKQEYGDILDSDWVTKSFPAVKHATVEEFNHMFESFSSKIDDELAGRNMYSRKETLSSRRFVFTQDACVSFIQAIVREGVLKIDVVCRSSHAKDVFPADLRLVYKIAKMVSSKLKSVGLAEEKVMFNFTLNSSHVTL